MRHRQRLGFCLYITVATDVDFIGNALVAPNGLSHQWLTWSGIVMILIMLKPAKMHGYNAHIVNLS